MNMTANLAAPASVDALIRRIVAPYVADLYRQDSLSGPGGRVILVPTEEP